MGKLSVLGAQRVKALESMLDDKKREELAKVKTKSNREIRTAVMQEFGIYDKYAEAHKLIDEADSLLKEISTVTGEVYSASMDYSSNHRSRSEFKSRVEELVREHDGMAERDAIKAKYSRKKQMLWLCETLEEAKAIVGLEEDNGDTSAD